MIVALNARVAGARHQAGLKVTADFTVAGVTRRAVAAVETAVDRRVAVDRAADTVVEAWAEEALAVVDAVSVVAVANVRMVARAEQRIGACDVVPLAGRVLVTHVTPTLAGAQVERRQLRARSGHQAEVRRVPAA